MDLRVKVKKMVASDFIWNCLTHGISILDTDSVAGKDQKVRA